MRSAELERDVGLRKSRAEMQATVFVSILLASILLLGWFAWRHALLSRHRNAISQKNVELIKTLAERDSEMERRAAVEITCAWHCFRLSRQIGPKANFSRI